MTCTFNEVWTGRTGDTCYLQVRDGKTSAAWIGKRGRGFASIEAGRKWLAGNGYQCVMPCTEVK